MTPARSEQYTETRQTDPGNNSGCLSGFLIPPLTALCIGLALAALSGGFNSLPAELAAARVNANAGKIAPLFSREIQYWANDIAYWAVNHGLDANLAATVMQIESCGNPRARSYAGASGLFQVMPFHFEPLEDHYSPETNALRGLGYLRQSFERAGGDIRLALAGYNGGIGLIGASETAWPAETQRYTYWGTGIYADASRNSSSSLRLDEWMQAGGASLCAEASRQLGLWP